MGLVPPVPSSGAEGWPTYPACSLMGMCEQSPKVEQSPQKAQQPPCADSGIVCTVPDPSQMTSYTLSPTPASAFPFFRLLALALPLIPLSQLETPAREAIQHFQVQMCLLL